MYKLFSILILASLTGCVSFPVPSYSGQEENLRQLAGASNQLKIITQPASFNDIGTIQCRGAGPVTVGKFGTYSAYIANALTEELTIGGAFSNTSQNILSVKLTKVDFSTSLGSTNWYLSGLYSIGDASVSIETIYNDKSSFSGNSACNNMALYFPKAVAMHLKQIYSSPLLQGALARKTNRNNSSLSAKLTELKNTFDAGLITQNEFDTKRRQILEEN